MHYGDMLAFDWRQRQNHTESPVHDFADLCVWDDRLQAYLAGFERLGRHGADRALEKISDPLTENDMFALSCQAVITHHHDLLRACIALAQALPAYGLAFSSALEWVDWSRAESALNLWPADDPARQAHLLRVIAHHPDLNLEPGYAVECIQRNTTSPEVQLSALWCALLRGESAWAVAAPELLDSDRADIRLAAAEALIVFGADDTRRAMLAIMRDLALGSGRVAMLATRDLMTLGGIQAEELLEALRGDAARGRQFVMALGWSGQCRHLPLLTGLFDDAKLARLAGAAVSTLTGSDPTADGWAEKPRPEPTAPVDIERDAMAPDSDRLPLTDPDTELRWPNRQRFADWLASTQVVLPLDQPVLAGRLRSRANLLAVLLQGRLASRPQASWLLQVATRCARLAHTAPAARQRAQMNLMTMDVHHG